MLGWFRPKQPANDAPADAGLRVAAAMVPTTDDCWRVTSGAMLSQGDLLPNCFVPVHVNPNPDSTDEVEVDVATLLVVTQSCDLEQQKVEFVALCPVHTLEEFESLNPDYAKKGKWEEVRRGRVEGLHMLPSPDQPNENRQSMVVNFRHVISLPIANLTEHAATLGNRWRLQSPFLEHFSQGFARFFMRVGLPSAIKVFK